MQSNYKTTFVRDEISILHLWSVGGLAPKKAVGNLYDYRNIGQVDLHTILAPSGSKFIRISWLLTSYKCM